MIPDEAMSPERFDFLRTNSAEMVRAGLGHWPTRRVTHSDIAALMARAWDEAYALGVQDERTSKANAGIAGCFCSTPSQCQCYIAPARVNPYRKEQGL